MMFATEVMSTLLLMVKPKYLTSRAVGLNGCRGSLKYPCMRAPASADCLSMKLRLGEAPSGCCAGTTLWCCCIADVQSRQGSSSPLSSSSDAACAELPGKARLSLNMTFRSRRGLVILVQHTAYRKNSQAVSKVKAGGLTQAQRRKTSSKRVLPRQRPMLTSSGAPQCIQCRAKPIARQAHRPGRTHRVGTSDCH